MRSPGGGSRRSCVERRLGFASRFLAIGHPSSRLTWQRSSRKRRCSLNEFPSLTMCKSGGCCSFSAQPREQIIGSEQFHQSTPQSTPNSTIRVCCGASAASCRWTGCLRTHMRQHPCLGLQKRSQRLGRLLPDSTSRCALL